jgi:site-specific recombinase XerD
VKTFLYSDVVEGYILSLNARHLSEHTISDYSRTLHKFGEFLEVDLCVDQITHRHIESFLTVNPKLSNKSVLNRYIGLSSLWTWLIHEEIVTVNVVRKLKPPKPQKKDVTPLSETEVKAIFSVLSRSKVYHRQVDHQGVNVDHELSSFERNRAMLLLMLDTGIRASELCDLNIEDLKQKNSQIYVRKGKGDRERILPFSPRTGQMIWRYLASRKNADPKEPLFLSKIGRRLHRDKLSHMVADIGRRAGVPDVYPHRFRHTFAIQYLRNGGNAYTLQRMLGHSTLETVKIYLKIAQVDIDAVHRIASPVDNWRL